MNEGKGHDLAAPRGASMPVAGSSPGRSRVICFGGAAIDRKYMAHQAIRAATSNPATGSLDFGGVARNVAANLARLGVAASLVSIVGDDADGPSLIGHLRGLGIDAEGVKVAPHHRTAEYVAILHPDRTLAVGMAEMAVFDHLALADLSASLTRSGTPDWIFADGNLPSDVLGALIEGDVRGSAKLAVDAVSAPKAERLPPDLSGIDLLFLNLDEAAAILGEPIGHLSADSALPGLRSRGAQAIVLTLGRRGLVLYDYVGDVVHLPAVPAEPVDVTGAGDALIAVALAWRLDGATLAEAARMGTLAAALTLEQEGSTYSGLSRDILAGAIGRLPRVS